MAFNVDYSAALNQAASAGNALSGLGQKLGAIPAQMQAKEKEQQFNELLQSAVGGDKASLDQLYSINPDIAKKIEERGFKLEDRQLEQNDRFKSQKAIDTAGLVEQIHLTPKEQQEAMFNAAVNDDRFDIDEEDRPYFMDPNARKAVITQVKGKDYAESFFGGDPKEMTAYQAEMIKGGNADREVRKLEVENKRIDNEIKRETNQAKLDALKAKTVANKDKQIQIKKARSETAQSVVDSGVSTLDIVNQIETHPGFSSAIGAKGASSLFGAFDEPISGTDAAGVAALIETLEAQNFLTAIGQFKSAGGAGALSDNEGKKLGAALTNLKRSQSENDFRKSLSVIKGLVKKQVSRAKGQVSKEFSLEESTSNTNEASDNIDLSKLSLEELKAMRGKL
tara:strand:+ start:20036 stop:21220 length:1185 start_codon:yes stop_codon:yes gene_type:complete